MALVVGGWVLGGAGWGAPLAHCGVAGGGGGGDTLCLCLCQAHYRWLMANGGGNVIVCLHRSCSWHFHIWQKTTIRHKSRTNGSRKTLQLSRSLTWWQKTRLTGSRLCCMQTCKRTHKTFQSSTIHHSWHLGEWQGNIQKFKRFMFFNGNIFPLLTLKYRCHSVFLLLNLMTT